jgi:hypothetical protein
MQRAVASLMAEGGDALWEGAARVLEGQRTIASLMAEGGNALCQGAARVLKGPKPPRSASTGD